MDPNANLLEIRRLVARSLINPLDSYDAVRLVDLIEALDEWLTRGGFLPTPWVRS